MAYGGLGFAAAMDALPAAFNFGKSLVGQDDASLDRALREKAMVADAALKDRQLRDSAIYQQGQLDAQRVQNENQRYGIDVTSRHYTDQAALQDFSNRTARQHYENTDDIQKRELGLKASEIPVINRLREAQISAANGAEDRASRGFQTEQDYRGALARQANAGAGGLELQTRQAQEIDDERRDIQTFLDNPYSLPPEKQRRFATELGVISHPDAGRAVQMFDQAVADYQKSGKKDLFNDKLRTTLAGPLQPLVDQNTNAEPGTYVFDGLEQAEGGVKMKLRLNPSLSGKAPAGTEKYQQLYVTNGRTPMAEGGEATVFAPQDIHQLLGGLRSGADWQKSNPDLAQAAQDSIAARSGAKNYSDFVKNKWMIEESRLQGAGNRAGYDQKMVEFEEKTRDALEKDVIRAIDDMSGFDAAKYANGDGDRAGQAAIQAIQQKRQRAIAAVREGLKNTPPEALRRMTADGILGTPALAPLLDEFRSSVVNPGTEPYAPSSQTGAINNPRSGRGGVSGAAGGQPSPFPQRP